MGGHVQQCLNRNIVLLLTLSLCFVLTSSHLNLYLTKPEVQRLFGLSAEMYYVREGVINAYALNFTVPVPGNLSKLFFTWNSLIKKPMPYLAQIEYDNGAAMNMPFLNIPSKGFVPKQSETFSLSLPCSGLLDGEVEVNLHLNISSTSKSRPNVTRLTIKRRKICLKELILPRNQSIYQQPKWSKPPTATLYVAVGIATIFTILILTATSVIYIRVKRNRDQSLNCRYYNGPGFLGAGNGSTFGTSRMLSPSLRSNSYATITSLKKIPNVVSPVHAPMSSSKVPANYCGSVHYASSPLLQLFSQSNSTTYSPAHSLLNTRLSQSSWCHSAKSFKSWRDPREIDPTERIRQLTVDRWRVVVGEVIHEGTFGRIHEGLCHDPYIQQTTSVVVKTVSSQASTAQTKILLKEGLLLANLQHPNLLPVLGVCSQDPKIPVLLYPYQGLSNLKMSLRGQNLSDGSKDGSKILTRDALKIAIGICHGIMYLHQQRILHKDIAARNCMIDRDFQGKLTDTALSRDLFPQDYHCLGDNENRPIKWLSLEAIVQKDFTPANDMWMFGVFLWELVVSAQQPFIEVDPFEMSAYLRDGYRLSQPHSCPDDLFAVMAICWSPFPLERPSFKIMLGALNDLYAAFSSFI